jgi:diacylglycerol kinase family enzyme
MNTNSDGPDRRHARSARRRWLARVSLAGGAAAVLVFATVSGVKGLVLLLVFAAAVAVIVLGVWLFVAYRGALRTTGLVVIVLVAASVTVVGIAADLLWLVVLCAALLAGGYVVGRAAIAPAADRDVQPEFIVPPPRHPFFIMNPRSGGGKVQRLQLREKAERLGARVVLLEGPHEWDIAALARAAIEGGADLLGVAGGDGSCGLVAAVAAEHDVPLLVIPAGTRNHFALDLGLDRRDPAKSLDALTDGVELRVDLGMVADRVFVNNVSFGAYAAIVERPDYRDDKVRVTLDVLPDILIGYDRQPMTVRAGDLVVTDPTAALVSNNPYNVDDIAGLGRRPRLDGGVLGLITVEVHSSREAAALLQGPRARGLTAITVPEVVVTARQATISAGIDGESVLLDTPAQCRVRVAALRVRVPRQRPGARPAREALTLGRLLRLAGPGHLETTGSGT